MSGEIEGYMWVVSNVGNLNYSVLINFRRMCLFLILSIALIVSIILLMT